ncbi:MAG: AMP-binding protein, partial [Clostridia bacterium]|nr:AMP-binding protein [Clostridia bacterium]
MKLSVSTSGWREMGWPEYENLARELKYSGIELHDALNPEFADMVRMCEDASRLELQGVGISCVDALGNPASGDAREACVNELKQLCELAKSLKCPFVRLRAQDTDDDIQTQGGNVRSVIDAVISGFSASGVTLLVETAGIFSDTERLKNLLDEYALDCLQALWDVHNTFRFSGETPERSITNLGAYVKHVHIKDSRLSGSRVEYVLPGEGDLPAKEVFEALRSISYAGYITLEWDKAWMDGLDDPYVVYTQFREFASMYEPTSYTDGALYTSVDGKGRYVWKHDELINENFPQVLDRMAETFPDQLCFKYTTLDYTRTYSQFRDDVDRCARAFIAVGVRPGSKVAVWATNLPAWYISFWAATKINATLVTMNTAYKIAEAEYLLRQSDTHTLIMINGYRDSDYVDTITRLCPEMEHSDPQKGLHCKKLPFLRNVITVGFRLKGCREWEEFLQESEKVPIEEVSRLSSLIKGDDVCNMQYTSGTTGFPKGVMLTHRGVVNNGKCIGDRMDLS